MSASPQSHRLPSGGLIDRTQSLSFTFDGETYEGYEGDTLASALLANGVDLVGRSFKYHRPRGLLSAGSEEPNGLVRLGEGNRARPNLRATEIPLFDGLVARSQNAWPKLSFDLGALAGLAARYLKAGFYYKTFLWPAGAWPFYEKLIRRAAGLGQPPCGPDPAQHEHHHQTCELLVIGAGRAGLVAALEAAEQGRRLILCDERAELGGSLAWTRDPVDGLEPIAWWDQAVEKLEQNPKVTLLANTTAFSCQNLPLVLLEERRPGGNHRLWIVRADAVVLAGGAIERPLVFPGNDRPGIMLASAVRFYIRHYGVKPGQRAVIVTNNDSAYEALEDLKSADIQVAGLIDMRPAEAAPFRPDGVPVFANYEIAGTRGRKRLKGLTLRYGVDGSRVDLDCDLLLMSGGWTPNLQLYAQAGGRLMMEPQIGAHLPHDATTPLAVVGAAAGKGVSPTAAMPLAKGPMAFMDFQNDVTTDDLDLAMAEGYGDIEHLKRYTTTGMGTDQGKTSNINALSFVAARQGRSAEAVGHTTFRPPFTPVSLGAVAGPARGRDLAPTRRTPFHKANEKAGAVFVTAGDWLYPRHYPHNGEDMAAAIAREVRNTRRQVGVVDMSSLGKIDVQGPDAPTFLERVYCNNLANLAIGRVRYGLMLRADGILFDDGTVARLGETHFLLTTTTARAGEVWQHLERLHQCHWPDLDIRLTSVTDAWAALAIAGPRARDLLTALGPDFPVDKESFPMASVREGLLDGLPIRLYRVSFSGELGYEIHTPAGYAEDLWEAVDVAGAPLGLMPYGLEALDVMRLEKGHISVGTEIDGRTTPADLGLGKLVSRKKDFLGRSLFQRPYLQGKGRLQLVGLQPVDGQTVLPIGAMITAHTWQGTTQVSLGYLTASLYSPSLEHPIALALLKDGHDRLGDEVWAVSPLANQSVRAAVVSPHFFDPGGERLNG
ncbi:MAG: 2Fe-2S iron-sulfur cluster-binding protein [Pseudomonadota bacterium]